MTRIQTIADITSQLASLDDAQVKAVADYVQDLTAPHVLPRELTARELALIEQSKEDFRTGRTHSSKEARALTAAFLEKLRVTR